MSHAHAVEGRLDFIISQQRSSSASPLSPAALEPTTRAHLHLEQPHATEEDEHATECVLSRRPETSSVDAWPRSRAASAWSPHGYSALVHTCRHRARAVAAMEELVRTVQVRCSLTAAWRTCARRCDVARTSERCSPAATQRTCV